MNKSTLACSLAVLGMLATATILPAPAQAAQRVTFSMPCTDTNGAPLATLTMTSTGAKAVGSNVQQTYDTISVQPAGITNKGMKVKGALYLYLNGAQKPARSKTFNIPTFTTRNLAWRVTVPANSAGTVRFNASIKLGNTTGICAQQ